MRYTLAAFYMAAGVVHLWAPDALLSITPSWVPFPRQVVLGTGLFELVASACLVTKPLRRVAGITLALYAICVWPANIKHAVDGIDVAYLPSSWWYHAPRLAFQLVIVWWALFSSAVIDWSSRRRD